jgi:hypothetical protein
MDRTYARLRKAVAAILPLLILAAMLARTAPVALAGSTTGWRSPAANSVYKTGFTNPANAYSDSSGYASRDNNANGVAHVYYNYGFAIPANAVIQGIQVRLDWWLDSTAGTNSVRVYLSWDGGANWTAFKSAATERTSDGNPTDIVGGASDTWGRTWAPSDFSNANFRVRLELRTNRSQRDFRIDWVPVQVTYNCPPTATNDSYTTAEETVLTVPRAWRAGQR